VTTFYDSAKLAWELIDRAELDGGGTVSTVPGLLIPSAGYVVGNPRHTLTLTQADRDDVLGTFDRIETWLHHAATITGYVGSWIDTDTGTLYLDVVDILPERVAAENLGRERGELAIYCLHRAEEIRLTADLITV